jgi:solute carrier family 25 carnitine/acylcarnitine transporter 20/29
MSLLSTDISFRRVLRGEYPFASVASTTAASQKTSLGEEVTPIPEVKEDHPVSTRDYTIEILQTLAAGGFAGSMSAIIPYPLDIIKTRLVRPQPHMYSRS